MEEWQKPENFAIGLGLVFLLFISLTALMVFITKLYFKRLIVEQEQKAAIKIGHQKELLQKSILVQERERERIAADLHDDLISKLNTISLIMATKESNTNSESYKMLLNSIKLARNISHDLMPPLIEQTQLSELFSDFLFPIQETHKVYLNLYGKKEISLNSGVKLQVFRMFQEVVNNILKHANAERIDVDLRIGINYLALRIIDNGTGFNTKELKKGLGLNNLAIRAQILEGFYKIKSELNQGTTFLFRFRISD